MKLKEALKIRQFDSDLHEAVLNVIFTASTLKCSFQRRLKPFGLTEEQYNVLRILRGSHPQLMKVKDITSRMVDHSSNTTRIIDKLETKLLVVRSTDPGNRRQALVGILPDGLALLKQLDELVQLPATPSLCPQEARQLSDLLDKLRETPF